MRISPTFLVLLGILIGIAGCTPVGNEVARKVVPDQQNEARIDNPDQVAETAGSVEPVLDASTRRAIQVYGPMIKVNAERYGIDWRLVLAMIKQESRFSPDAASSKGALGIMQLMPFTGEEVARDLDLQDLTHPKDNIHGGVFYFRRLYDMFEGPEDAERLKLALAAYNAGVGRIYDAQEVAAYMHDNPSRWQSIKDALPLLSKRYYTLHRSIWGQEKPKAGWFGNGGETVAYVDNVMRYYDEFRLLLN